MPGTLALCSHPWLGVRYGAAPGVFSLTYLSSKDPQAQLLYKLTAKVFLKNSRKPEIQPGCPTFALM